MALFTLISCREKTNIIDEKVESYKIGWKDGYKQCEYKNTLGIEEDSVMKEARFAVDYGFYEIQLIAKPTK